ncbi:uncharacterized protein L969DRAFT_102432 [Mixia osmundae IAM 14324]|uniref:AP complex mu/sigma subunit domain-containing protein n=1 Tax=Mixia osmundae (strain CBS 9802 / IAM 14324 / JCM 22182 / KY 12970) TaxID=764103 RepID=G7DU68_MIXOS|nr:uncharacterized protein L969DRAFT_102432 [Mixia osmundae IAM 14324]KEI40995.1 hypothetical protein L969DRAFT_102432 [Mixia osmundae IAM 14324]GAA94128.1 hypothetical protein E5Q_00776 [Mixia osmundae IAM 14324]
MIDAVLIFNQTGKPRLTKYYTPAPSHARIAVVNRVYELITARSESACNFIDIPEGLDGLGLRGGDAPPAVRQDIVPRANKVIFRHYATLYFAVVVDEAESELGILDLIQVFVEALDRCFENVCELDLIFHFDEVHALLDCMVVGGLVLDTSIDSISTNFRAQAKARKAASGASAMSDLTLPSLGSSLTGGWGNREGGFRPVLQEWRAHSAMLYNASSQPAGSRAYTTPF